MTAGCFGEDLVGGLGPDERFAALVPAIDRYDITVGTVYTAAQAGDLEYLATRVAGGSLPAAVGRRYRLDNGARAYVELESTPAAS